MNDGSGYPSYMSDPERRWWYRTLRTEVLEAAATKKGLRRRQRRVRIRHRRWA